MRARAGSYPYFKKNFKALSKVRARDKRQLVPYHEYASVNT